MSDEKKVMYYIYHVPGNKIGVTSNIELRLHTVQGLHPSEYEIVETSYDIKYVSRREMELQRKYNYTVETISYENLIKKDKGIMNLNITEATTTFPVPVSDLKKLLKNNLGTDWEIPQGEVFLDKSLAKWIVKNAKTSRYNSGRSYVYNAALFKSVGPDAVSKEEPSCPCVNEVNVYDLIREWAKERGIYDKGDTKTQFVKLMEESGELARAILKNDDEEFIDAIGDMVVVLTNLAKLKGLKIEDCVTSAYDVIAKRKGKMVDGTFVKDTL